MKKFKLTILIVVSVLLLVSCGKNFENNNTQEANMRTVTDCYDYSVDIPNEIDSISTNYQSATQIMLMLGGENIISGTSPKYISRPWVQLMYPEFCERVSVPFDKNGEFNVEELLKEKPDVFLSYNTNDTDIVRNAGVTTANIGLYDYAGIEQSILKIGEIMGDEYYNKALEWQKYFDKNLKFVEERVKNIPDSERRKVLFLRGDFEKTYGKDSVISSWINLAGGVNVLDGLNSKESIVTPSAEEILLSEPDIIIIGDTNRYTESYDNIVNDDRFSSLGAIKDNNIIFNPYGMHQWEKYSGESALQILWAAKTFYPELFEDIDLVKEVKFFYKEFHNFELSDTQAEYMLQGKNPDGNRS